MIMTSNSKKRLLYFVPEFPRLTETFIEREVSKLLDFGNLDITVFSMAKASGKMSPAVEKVTVFERLSLVHVVKASIKYIVLHPLQVLRAHALVWGHDPVPYLFPKSSKNTRHKAMDNLSVIGKFHRTRFMQFLKGIAYASVFAKYKPEHIHCHFLSETSTLVMVAAHLLNIPYSVSAHAKDVWVEGSLIKAKVKTAKFISVCNSSTFSKIKELAGDTDTSTVYLLFHGIDATKLFENIQNLSKPTRPVILNVGRFVAKKGQEYLVEASNILVSRGIDHEVHFIGASDPFYPETYKKITALINDYKLNDHVFIEGDGKGLANSDVAAFLSIADIFVFPGTVSTEGDVDGVPNTIIEAALAKVPVVTTRVGSITDLITEDSGVLVKEKDPLSLADGIEMLLKDKSIGKKHAEAAYLKATQKFNLEKNTSSLEALLLN